MLLIKKMLPVVLAVITTTTGTLAQNADLDKYMIQYQYRDLPHQPVCPNAATYSVKVVVPGSISNAIAVESIREGCAIEGMARKRGAAAINVTFTTGDLVFGDITIEEKVEKQKDKDGNEVRVTSYYAQCNYSLQTDTKATDSTGMKVYSRRLVLSDTYTSPYQRNRKDASEYWNNNRESLKSPLATQLVNRATATIGKDLSYSFGYTACSGTDILWILNAKKHPEHAAQQAMVVTIQQAFKGMLANETLDNFNEAMGPVLAYFDDVKSRYTTTSKADKKMRYGAFFNKALIYLYMDKPALAITEAEGLVANDYDTRDGENLKKRAMELRDLFLKNARNSRHFIPQGNL